MFSTAYLPGYASPSTLSTLNLTMSNIAVNNPNTPQPPSPLSPQRAPPQFRHNPHRLHPSASMPNMWPAAFQQYADQGQAQAQYAHLGSDGNLYSTRPATKNATAENSDEHGQPLTPPQTPNSRLPLPQPHSYNLSSQLTPQRFDPFARSPPPSGDAGQGHFPVEQVQFPRTEAVDEQPQDQDLEVIRRTVTSSRTNQGTASPGPGVADGMERWHSAGRFLLVGGVPKEANASALTHAFVRLGDLKGIFVRFQSEHGAVVLAFYDMRHAARAHREIRTLRFFPEGVRLASRLISPAELRKYTGNSMFVDDAEGEVYISTMGDGVMNQLALQNALAGYGGLRQFRVVGAHGKAFFAEYFDTRDATAAVAELHDRTLTGVHLRLTHRHPPQPLLPTSQPLPPLLTISDLQRRHDELALFAHFHQLVASKQPPRGSNVTPDGSEGARGGPYDTGTFGRRGSFPGSSPRVDEKEERYAALAAAAEDEARERERERKGSNVYGADHSKAVLPSYPHSLPRTPLALPHTPTHTPKRKVSLPPYTGPLPLPPSAHPGSNLQWPLPLRIPTPPPSSSTANSSSHSNSGSSGADSPEFFIPTQTPPRRQARGPGTGPGGGVQAAHAFLPASARAVLDLLREPPPERNRIDIARIEQGLDTRTTVMLKNVPNKMTDRHLMSFIDSVTPRSYSFLYLRMDFENHCNVGYAFVNFIEVASLLRFAKTKLGQKWGMFSSEKVLHMSYANYQGKEALIEKFRNSGVMEEREAWRPKIFYSSGSMIGLPEPFPPANNHLRQQRSFQNGRTQGLFNASTTGPQLNP